MIDNGRNRWLLWTAGIIMTFILTAITFLGTNVVANDKEARARDSSLEIRLSQRIEKNQERIQINQEKNQEKLEVINKGTTDILVAIAELKKDVQKIQ